MGDRGPLPTDYEILKLRGSRAATKRDVPVSENAVPPKIPSDLGKIAKKKWKEITADLKRRGLAPEITALG